jgi:hypothetical protein
MEIAVATLVSFALCSISSESDSIHHLLPFASIGLSQQDDSISIESVSMVLSVEYARTIDWESPKISLRFPPTKDSMYGFYFGVDGQTTSSDLFRRDSYHVGLEYTLFDSTADGEESRFLAINPQYYMFGGLIVPDDWIATASCTGSCPPQYTPPHNDEIGVEVGIRGNLYRGVGVIYSYDNIKKTGYLGITTQFQF